MMIKTAIIGALLFFGWSSSIAPAVGLYSVDVSRQYIQILENQVFECVAGKRVRVYFNSVDWVEIKCQITDDNLWSRKSFRNVTTGALQ